MSKPTVFFLGFIQAIAEFLPISSSGHLNLFQHALNYQNSLILDIFLNTASLLSVLVFFRHRLTTIIKNTPHLLVSTLPLILFVLILGDSLDHLFQNQTLISLGFLLTSVLLLLTKFIKPDSRQLNLKKAFLIGLLQILAIFPGVSRSTTTIFAGLLLGLSAQHAFEYSFYLYIPCSFGALAMSMSKGLTVSYLIDFWPAFLVCFLLGLLSLKILKKIIINNRLWYFSIYTLIMSFLTFTLSA